MSFDFAASCNACAFCSPYGPIVSPTSMTTAVNVVSANTTDAQMRSFESPAARSAVSSPLPASPPRPSRPPISAE